LKKRRKKDSGFQVQGLSVKVPKGQSIEKAISIFKRKVKESGLMFELRERSFYTKKSDKLREKKKKANLRRKYKNLKNTH